MRPLLPRDADLEVEHLPPPDKEQTAYNFDVAFLSGDGKDMSWIVRACRAAGSMASSEHLGFRPFWLLSRTSGPVFASAGPGLLTSNDPPDAAAISLRSA